jgi:hypothetical protein
MNVDIEKRKESFDSFRKERMPVLHEFSSNLGFQNPHEILLLPEKFLNALDEWLSIQEIEENNRMWLATRVGYYIGEYFVVKYGGCWSVSEAKNSRYYGHYVVGDFSAFGNPNTLIEPMEAAMEFVAMPKGRSLSKLINEITEALEGL